MDAQTELIESRNGNDQSGDSTALPLGAMDGPPKRGRGRPPGSKSKNGPVDIGGKKESFPRNDPDPDALESAKFIGAAVVSLVELLESIVHGSCERKIEKKLPGKISEFRQELEKYKLTDKEREMLSNSSSKIAVRHEWLTKFAPEVVLSVTLGQYGLRQASLVKFVNGVTQGRSGENSQPAPLPEK